METKQTYAKTTMARTNHTARTLMGLAAAAIAISAVCAATSAWTGKPASADVHADPAAAIGVPPVTHILVRYGQTDRAAGMPEFEYLPVEAVTSGTPTDLDTYLLDYFLGLIGETDRAAGTPEFYFVLAGPVAAIAPPVSGQMVRSGETDRAAGMSEFYFVPIEVAAAVDAPASQPYLALGETDMMSGLGQ